MVDLSPGDTVSFPVADGKAHYEIVEVGETVSKVKHIGGYSAKHTVDSDGRILTSILESRVNAEETLEDLFG